MAQTEFTGRLMELLWDTEANLVTFAGLTRVEINESDGPDAEQLDVTVAGDGAYTWLTDPLGSKGDDKTTVTATIWASTIAMDDITIAGSHIAFNAADQLVLDMAKGTATANTYTHLTMQLTKRVTEIPFDAYATQTLTFEANALGAWTSPA